MTRISVDELIHDADKYFDMVAIEDILMTKNGRVIAALSAGENERLKAAKRLLNLFPDGLDVDLDRSREERLK